MSSSQTIEHIVLFKVKDDTDPSKSTTMIKELNGLNSLDQVVHLSAGAIHKNRSTSFNFTHMLHSRYNSKEALAEYSAHPSHLSVVKESVFPICDDLLAIDWVNSDLNGPLVLKPGSVMRITLLKLKEGLGDAEKNEVLGITKGVKEYFPTIEQISVGENFSPARAKGFSIGSIAIFPGMSEFEAADSNQEIVEEQKVKVRPHLESVIVLDYVIPSQSASLWDEGYAFLV